MIAPYILPLVVLAALFVHHFVASAAVFGTALPASLAGTSAHHHTRKL